MPLTIGKTLLQLGFLQYLTFYHPTFLHEKSTHHSGRCFYIL
nr:MAG TPA: hypothetical protein [Bacteriophage sp.]